MKRSMKRNAKWLMILATVGAVGTTGIWVTAKSAPQNTTSSTVTTSKAASAKAESAKAASKKTVTVRKTSVDTPGGTKEKWASAVEPKPLSDNVKKGLSWLAKTQHQDGGWSQGEESAGMGNAMQGVKDKSNVADTCAAALALLRASNTPTKGEYAKNVKAAVEYVCAQIEESDEKSLWVTSIRNTRLQAKLGPYIDTFMASLLLAEVKGEMNGSDDEKRVEAALAKVLNKIEKNQKTDGTWDNQGWAPVLSQSMASKAINRAAQNGAKVSEPMRQRAEKYAHGQYDKKSGSFGGGGSAGVDLYAGAGNLGAMRDADNTNRGQEQKAKAVLAQPSSTPAARKDAEDTIKRIESNRSSLEAAQGTIVKKLDDKQFVSGFGSNGGEEFLSYMNIGESLVAKGGDDWKKWDSSMSQNLNRIQNDGTWSGHHCITGRTFCTSAALLTLMVDRTPAPISERLKRG
jgi:hypothetical protein